jgi:hypothetical protein
MEFNNTDYLVRSSDVGSTYYADVAYIEDLQTMDEYVFYREHDEEFDYYEQHMGNSACGRISSGLRQKKSGRDRYKKLKCTPDEQIRYAQKMAVKRVNVLKKKENDMYARNRRDARSAVLQETKAPDDDMVEDLNSNSSWNFDEEIDWIEKELLRYQYGAVIYQKLFGDPLETMTDGVDTYHYYYI